MIVTHGGKTSPRKLKSSMQRMRKKSRTGRMRRRGSTHRERVLVRYSPQLWLVRVHSPCNEQIWSSKPSMSVSWHSTAHPMHVLWMGVAVSGSTQPQTVLQCKTECGFCWLVWACTHPQHTPQLGEHSPVGSTAINFTYIAITGPI